MKKAVATILSLLCINAWSFSQQTFSILVNRTANVGDSLITGVIYVNGEALGKTYENRDSLVTSGKYKGLMRYFSPRGFTSGPFGKIGKEGDFLLEIERALSESGRVKTNVLFHTGFLPKHTEGCILLGPASGPRGARYIPDDHVLRKLRRKFYGTETPQSCPDMNIEIEIRNSFR